MDRLDRTILEQLQKNARISNLHLSQLISLSPSQTSIRVRKLEEKRIIRGYAVQVSSEAAGIGVIAFVGLLLKKNGVLNVREIEKNIKAFPNIIECHSISGDFDYILKVVSPDLKSLSQFLTDTLLQVPGVASLHSNVCMEEIKPLSVFSTL